MEVPYAFCITMPRSLIHLNFLLCVQEPNIDQDLANLLPLIDHDASPEQLTRTLCLLEGDADGANRLYKAREYASTFGPSIQVPKVQAGI